MPAKRDKRQELFDTSRYGHFYVPDEVVRFLVGLTQPTPGESVLGIGFYADGLNSILGKYGVKGHSISAEALPSAQFEALSRQSFDVILCAPAFGVIYPESNEPSEEMWIKWSIDHLGQSGRLAIIVPIGLLSNYSQEPVRSFLLEKGGLEAVIEIPSGWAQGTAIQASILYLTTNRQPERPVRMFRFSTPQDVPWSILEHEVRKIDPKLPASSNGKTYTMLASQLDSARLDAKYYDPQYSVSPPDSTFRAFKLAELVEIRSGDRFKGDDLQLQGVPFVQVRNLSVDGTIDLHDVRTIKPSIAANSRSFSIPGDILISIAGTVGKVALVPYQTNVCIDTSLRQLRVRDTSRVVPEYLAHYLQSDIAKLQMERWFSGSVIRVLSTPNLEQLIVYLPELSKQREIVNTFQSLARKHTEQLLLAFPNIERMLLISGRSTQSTANEQSMKVSAAEPGMPPQDIIRTEFPFPIARAFTVFETSANESPVSRVKKLIGISEAIVYYLFGVLAADQLRRIRLTDPDLKSFLNNSVLEYSLDRRIKYVLRITKLSQDEPSVALFVPEIADAEFGICSEIHNNVRNKFSHTDLSEAWCKKVVKDYYPKLTKLLESLLPIRSYRLAQVTHVTVRDGRPQHHITTMVGDNSLFPTQVEDLDNLLPADTQHVILLDENYNVLDLHPFYMIHAWESTGMRDQLCFLKQVIGQHPRQRLRIESAEGAGETEVEMDLQLAKLL